MQQTLKKLMQVNRNITRSLSLPDVLDSILDAALALVPALDAHVFLFDGQTLTFGAAKWADGRDETPFTTVRPGGLTDTVARTGETIIVNTMQNHPLFHSAPPDWTGSILGIPLKVEEKVVGVMNVAFEEPREFPDTEIQVLNLLASQAAIAIQNARLYEQARQEIADRKQTEAFLRESEQKYRALVEQASEAIGLLYDGRFEITNQRFKDFVGVAPATVPNLQDWLFELAVPNSRQAIANLLKDLSLAEATSVSGEFTAVNAAGKPQDIAVSMSSFPYKQGYALQIVLEDISVRKSLKYRQQQLQKMRTIGELTAGIAHHFNNILTSVIGRVALALADMAPGDRHYDDMRHIQAQTRRMASLIEQLLDFANHAPLSNHPVNLNQVMLDARRRIRQMLRPGVELSIELSPHLPAVNGNLNALEQIVMSLCQNADNAMPDGGLLTIKTAVGKPAHLPPELASPATDDFVILTVSDTGLGMDADTQAHIFEPFFTTQESVSASGLGLAIAASLAHQQDGFFQVESQPNRGSTFKLYLPALADSAEPAVENLATGSETLLIIEDQTTMVPVLRQVLENAGYTVLTAANPAEGLSRWQRASEHVHVVVGDETVVDLRRQMAQAGQNKPPHALVIGAHVDGPDLSRPDVATLPPVFSPHVLTETIRHMLDATNKSG